MIDYSNLQKEDAYTVSREIKNMLIFLNVWHHLKNVVPGVSVGPGVYFIHSAALYIQHIFSGGFRGGAVAPFPLLATSRNMEESM